MAWIRIDDQFADHPKFLEIDGDLEDAATALWVRALGYCNKHRTDGHIVKGALRRLSRASNPEAVAAELVRVGLWKTTERGWLVHDYHEYQPRSEKALATKEQLSAAGKKAAAARWGTDPDAIGCDPHANRIAIGCDRDAVPMPPIPYPIPIPDDVVEGVARAGEAEPEDPEGATREPPPDFIGMAYYLAQRGDSWGQSLCDRIAEGRSLTKVMRDKLPAAYARAREGEAAAARLAEVKASAPPAGPAGSPDADLRAWASQRWVEARQKRKLAAQEPDQRLISELCAIAASAAAGAKPDKDGWKPTVRHVVAFWIRRFLAERQETAGGPQDRGYPLAWLPGRCREYPLPRQSDMKPADHAAAEQPADGAVPPPGGAEEPPPATQRGAAGHGSERAPQRAPTSQGGQVVSLELMKSCAAAARDALAMPPVRVVRDATTGAAIQQAGGAR
jgi:hypothetical protein